jgi:prepilin peptidase CpaA
MIVFWALGLWAAVIAVYDWRQLRVPNALLLLMLVPAVLALIFDTHGLLGAARLSSLGGMVLGFALTLPGYVLKRFGAGDVKFAAVIGLLLGTPRGFEMVLGASVLMGAAALALTVMKLPRQMKFAAAPMLSAAFIVEMLWGPLLVG